MKEAGDDLVFDVLEIPAQIACSVILDNDM